MTCPDAACRLRIVAVGDELLEGRTADTNSRRIQRALGQHVTRAESVQVVPDERAAIAAALERSEPGDLVFVCGGLGSTPDDLTREAVAAWGGVDLPEDPQLRERIEQRLRTRGIPIKRGVMNQAQVPQGLEPLENPVGSAPGLAGRLRDRTFVLLPGVPGELAGLLPKVVDWLQERSLLPTARPTRLWRTAQVPELAVVRLCEPVRERWPALQWSYWLTRWGVDVRIAVEPGAARLLDEAAPALDEALAHRVYAREMLPLPLVVQNDLLARGRTVATAESCTAGLIGGALTDAAGSSGCFRGGLIVYADEAKQSLAGVPQQMLIQHGAVSEEVVRALAEGSRARLAADYALAVSGISGPGGGTEGKPVGTTWIAVATPAATFAARYRFLADRERNRALTVAVAIDSLRRVLETSDATDPFRDDDFWARRS
jgi:nicotinamide-nucleotide amidase